MDNLWYDFKLNIDGMGIVLYSDEAVKHIKQGENYFAKEYATPEQVAMHIQKGDIVGFSTGSSGEYNIKTRTGYPDKETEEQYPISIRLAIDIKGGSLSIIDLFWLMDWDADCPN